MPPQKLSVVIPCYNEEKTLETIVGKVLAADRMGVKPLVFALLPDGGLAFASEIDALRAHPRLDLGLDREALSAGGLSEAEAYASWVEYFDPAERHALMGLGGLPHRARRRSTPCSRPICCRSSLATCWPMVMP